MKKQQSSAGYLQSVAGMFESDDKWVDGLPKEVGDYWFYGWASEWGSRNNKPTLCHMRVHQGSNTLVYVAEGQFYYLDAVGKHCKAELPEVPELGEE